MDTPDLPSLADDEAALARYATVLADAMDSVLEGWFDRCVGTFVPLTTWLDTEAGTSYRTDATRAVTETMTAVRALLAADIRDQAASPLEIVRHAVSFPTAILQAAGVAPIERDDFARRSFPEDLYGLAPATFADVDESLHEPGLIWGAAKAHVHLRRRREQQTPGAHAVVVLCNDLMDRSKISGAFPDASFVRKPDALAATSNAGATVIVDLRLIADAAALRDIPGRVIAFGSHVDEDVLAAAKDVGVEALPRSVFFKRVASGSLLG